MYPNPGYCHRMPPQISDQAANHIAWLAVLVGAYLVMFKIMLTLLDAFTSGSAW